MTFSLIVFRKSSSLNWLKSIVEWACKIHSSIKDLFDLHPELGFEFFSINLF